MGEQKRPAPGSNKPTSYIYMQPLGGANLKPWGESDYGFPCCWGTLSESFAKLGDSVFFTQEESAPSSSASSSAASALLDPAEAEGAAGGGVEGAAEGGAAAATIAATASTAAATTTSLYVNQFVSARAKWGALTVDQVVGCTIVG